MPHDRAIQGSLVFEGSLLRVREDTEIQPLWINPLISMQHNSRRSHFREALDHWVKEHSGSEDRIDLITSFLFHTEPTHFCYSAKDWLYTQESLSGRVETSSLWGPRWLPSAFHPRGPDSHRACPVHCLHKNEIRSPYLEMWDQAYCSLLGTTRISSLEWNDPSHHCHYLKDTISRLRYGQQRLNSPFSEFRDTPLPC